MTRRYYPISSRSWTTEDALDFSREALIRDGRKLIEEKHPELLERGINQDTVINVQAKQLLKARKNAEAWVAANRRDQAKIAELRAENKELRATVINLLAWVEQLETDNQLDRIAFGLYEADKEKAMQTLEGGAA